MGVSVGPYYEWDLVSVCEVCKGRSIKGRGWTINVHIGRSQNQLRGVEFDSNGYLVWGGKLLELPAFGFNVFVENDSSPRSDLPFFAVVGDQILINGWELMLVVGIGFSSKNNRVPSTVGVS